MKIIVVIFASYFLSPNSYSQQYNRDPACGTDTINVDYIDRMSRGRVVYKAFECTQVSKMGLRFDIGFNAYSYNSNTKQWLGNHNGGIIGVAIAYKNFNFTATFKPATVRPGTELVFNGDTLTNNAELNPIKVDYDIGYSIDLRHNFSIEPFIGLTRNSFYVINEEELNKTFNIPTSTGLLMGVALNKYFKVKKFQFISLFTKFGYGLMNFKKTNRQLGTGYSNLAVGLAYKSFFKRKFHKRIN